MISSRSPIEPIQAILFPLSPQKPRAVIQKRFSRYRLRAFSISSGDIASSGSAISGGGGSTFVDSAISAPSAFDCLPAPLFREVASEDADLSAGFPDFFAAPDLLLLADLSADLVSVDLVSDDFAPEATLAVDFPTDDF